MRIALLLLVLELALALSACRTESEKACAAMLDRLAECSGELPSGARSSVTEQCAVMLAQDLPPDDKSLAGDYKRAMSECTAATTCPALESCLDRHQCQLILTSPDDDSPDLNCRK